MAAEWRITLSAFALRATADKTLIRPTRHARCVNSTFTPTRQINVTSPSVSNLANVRASLIADLRKRGVKRA